MIARKAPIAVSGLLLLGVLLGATPGGRAQGLAEPSEPGPSALNESPPSPLIPVDPDFEEKKNVATIDPRIGDFIALQAGFTDDTGAAVTIGEYFQGEKPVVLTLTYYTCPMMCNIVLNGLLTALRDLKWTAGKDFTVINVSIDPRDDPEASKIRKIGNLSTYGREGAGSGWHFLTGTEESIRAVADSIGFGYGWDEEKEEFAHGAGLFLLTPKGQLARVLQGVSYDENLRFALLEAGKGQIGSSMDKFLFMCWRWDPEVGKYVPFAITVMRVGGLLTVLSVVVFVFIFSRAGRQHREALAKSPAVPATPDPENRSSVGTEA